jgi:Gram-negative porin
MRILLMQRARFRSRHLFRNLGALILLAMLGNPLSAVAAGEDPSASIFSFSAFGTLGLVHSSEARADFTDDIFEANGAGYTRQWSPSVDSRVGGQIIASFTPQLAAMLQIISDQNYDGSFTPHVEWANLTYRFNTDLSMRVGRIVLPSFLFSESRNVAYATPWVRLPVELYSLVPVSSSDGVDVSYALHSGRVIQTLVGTYGATNSTLPGGSSTGARRQWTISDTIEFGSLMAHLTYQQANLTVSSLHTLFGAFREFGPQGNALADTYDPYNRRLTFLGIGAMYDPGSWFLAGEWGTTDLHSVFGKSTAWYASAGYRLGKLTPYLTYGELQANGNRTDPGLPVSELPPFLTVPATGLNAALNSLLGSLADQRTISVGTRWDFAKNVDLKLQYDHTRRGAGSPGTLVNLQPGFQTGGTVNLLSIAVDFVW